MTHRFDVQSDPLFVGLSVSFREVRVMLGGYWVFTGVHTPLLRLSLGYHTDMEIRGLLFDYVACVAGLSRSLLREYGFEKTIIATVNRHHAQQRCMTHILAHHLGHFELISHVRQGFEHHEVLLFYPLEWSPELSYC